MHILRRLPFVSSFLVAVPATLGLPAPDDTTPSQARHVSAPDVSAPTNVSLAENRLTIRGSEFLQSCWWVALRSDGHTLEACCESGISSGPWWTRMHLANCLSNQNGVLTATKNGNFQVACRACKWIGGPSGTFSCYCDAPWQSNLYTEASLNDIIGSYSWSQLECFGIHGPRIQQC
ncbi:hypothetical protein V8F33_011822 [Rhypophila sp. PSN 637]